MHQSQIEANQLNQGEERQEHSHVIKSYVKPWSKYSKKIVWSGNTTTTSRHHEEVPLSHHDTSGRQIKQSNQLSLPHQDDCNTRKDIK